MSIQDFETDLEKNLLTHLCARRGARLVFIVPSAINPPFANNIGMNLILITALGSLPRPRLHVIRFQGRAAPNATFRRKIVPAPP